MRRRATIPTILTEEPQAGDIRTRTRCIGICSVAFGIAPQPDHERARTPADLGLIWSGQDARFEKNTIRPRCAEQFVAQRKFRAVACRHFHQAAGYVDGIASRRDVLIASAAEPGGDDYPGMGTDLESKSRIR